MAFPQTTDKLGRTPAVALGIRAAQFFFVIVTLGLTGDAVRRLSGGSLAINFLLAALVIALFYLLYVAIVGYVKPQFVPALAVFIADLVLAIFFFSGFIAVAAYVGTTNCNVYTYAFDFWGNAWGGRNNTFKTFCQETKAAAAMGAFSWVLFVVSTVFIGTNVFSTSNHDQAIATPTTLGGLALTTAPMAGEGVVDPNVPVGAVPGAVPPQDPNGYYTLPRDLEEGKEVASQDPPSNDLPEPVLEPAGVPENKV